MIINSYSNFINEENLEFFSQIDLELSQTNSINDKIAYLDNMLLFSTNNNDNLILNLAIADLRLQLAESQIIDKSNMCWIDMHGFSNNYMFEYAQGSPTGMRKTKAYKYWLDKFPLHQLDYLDLNNVDFTKPIQIILDFVSIAKFDVENLVKSILDIVFATYLKVDDNIVTSIIANRVDTCQEKKDGKIGILIRNL